ncbi:MAG: hypothetical protein WB612_03380, partial [Nitrososphaeraceae archaeon]
TFICYQSNFTSEKYQTVFVGEFISVRTVPERRLQDYIHYLGCAFKQHVRYRQRNKYRVIFSSFSSLIEDMNNYQLADFDLVACEQD